MSRRFLKLVVIPAALATAALLLGLALASGGNNEVSAAPGIGPQDFTTKVDNPFFPLSPGARWVYEGHGEEGVKRVVIEVMQDTHEVMGVDTVVVRDTVTVNGVLFEDTYDWYAQDRDGNVWYFGEDVRYEDGRPVADEGSWTAGVDGARPGILMKATPAVGDHYTQEYFDGQAMARAEVVRLDAQIDVPYGTLGGLLQTKDTTPTEPGIHEQKYYARGVGLVAEIKVGEDEVVELVEATLP
ncbi:MAG TPA: hypothetical protein VGL92_16815 [Acidimicrobiia bacterium]|jgi:hypothetical protein